MRRGLVATIALAVLFVACRAAWAQPQPQPRAPTEALALARGAFQRGDYKKVVDALTPALYPYPQFRAEDEEKEARKLLAVSHYYQARFDLSRQEFIALLRIDPRYTLDPAVESPEVYAFLEKLKREIKDKIKQIEIEKQQEEERKKQPQREVLVETTIQIVSPWGNFVPFGYGQFRNGQPGKGVFFLVAHTVSAATSVSLFTWQAVTYGIPSHYPPGTDLDRIRLFQTIQVVSGIAFVGTYIWAVVDAFQNQPKRISTIRTERPYKPPPTKPSASLLITPVVSPEAIGLGATWRF